MKAESFSGKSWEILMEQGVMSHVCFGPDGKIIFHTDYWDTSVAFERVPILGSIIRCAKEQF
jgi:hypothetical protein